MSTKLSVESLKGIQVLAQDDIYDLAQLVLRLQMAGDRLRSTRCHVTTRMNIRGFAQALASLAGVSTESVLALLDASGIPLGAMVVTAEEAAVS